jgi:hypothetical protein
MDQPVFEYCAQLLHTHELGHSQALVFSPPEGWEQEHQGMIPGQAVVTLGALDGGKRAMLPAIFILWRRRKKPIV